ncbi:hypothetical protein GDO81_022298 [Engystomops pustulosus]|uniref:Uncharacterized protein n=1 Tax=Engystomops pustulosus TaxID=76066 RepID=A0AAV6ZBA5_ENGPU|nr:hypothetical protein GDO81_022298 [Engystomops pustulosus]
MGAECPPGAASPNPPGADGDEQCLLLNDGAPAIKGRTKWCREQNTEILGPWPGNSPDLIPLRTYGQSSGDGGQTKPNTL